MDNEEKKFTICAISNSIGCNDLRRIIARWHTNGVTDHQILKILGIYLGVAEWMNLDKLYPCYNFGDIAKGLGFKSKTDFLEVLLLATGFGLIWKDRRKGKTPANLEAFYTPLWHVAKEEEINGENNGEKEGKFPELRMLDYDNNLKKKYIKKKNENISKYASAPYSGNSDRETTRIIEQKARALFNFIITDEDAYQRIVKPLNEKMQQKVSNLYTDASQHHPINEGARHFLNSYLWPYVLKNGATKLLSTKSTYGNSFWIENLLKFDFMQKFIDQAAADMNRKLIQSPGMLIRQNRPISPFEYQDPETGQRLYDETQMKDGQQLTLQHRIPKEAPPRPSEKARWNKFAKGWDKGEETQPR